MSTRPTVLDSASDCRHDRGHRVGEDELGREAARVPGHVVEEDGSSSVIPTKTAMAPAVWRMTRRARARTMRRGPGRRPTERRARSTPGLARARPSGRRPTSTAWPTKNDSEAEHLADDQGAERRRRATFAAAARRGVAWPPGRSGWCRCRTRRSWTSTPRTPMASEPRASPARDWLVGSKPWYQPARMVRALRAARKVTSRVPTTVTSRVHLVERSERAWSTRPGWPGASPARQWRVVGGRRRWSWSRSSQRVLFSARRRVDAASVGRASGTRRTSLVSSMKTSSSDARTGVSSCTVSA